MQYFHDISGFQVNEDKFFIYIIGLDEERKNDIIDFSGFKQGEFFMKYFGVVLFHKKWNVNDCQVITEKIIKRIKYWILRRLIYVGRVILVNFILFFF